MISEDCARDFGRTEHGQRLPERLTPQAVKLDLFGCRYHHGRQYDLADCRLLR